MQIIYIDTLFFLSLLTDYLLCLSAGRICGLVLRRGRYGAAALFGAVYAVAVFLPRLRFLSLPAARLGAGLVMGLIAFGRERRPLRCTAVLFAVSAAFGGALWALSSAGGAELRAAPLPLSLPALLLCFALCYTLMQLLFRSKALMTQRQRVAVTLRFLGREARFPALVDTGNALRDPATGARVLVACPHALQPVFLENTALFSNLSPVELLEISAHVPALAGKLRLLPFSHLSGEGLLPVFHPDSLLLDGAEDRELLVAVSSRAAGDGFEGLL